MTRRPSLEDRIDELTAMVLDLQQANRQLTERLAVISDRPQVLIGRTEAPSGSGGLPDPLNYPNSGNTFGVVTRLGATFTEAVGSQNITGDMASDEVQRIARTVPGRYLPRHTDVAYMLYKGRYYILSGLDIYLEEATVGSANIAPGGSGEIIVNGQSKTGHWTHVHNDKTLAPNDPIWVQVNGTEYDIVIGPCFCDEQTPTEPGTSLVKATVGSSPITPGGVGTIYIDGSPYNGYWDHTHNDMTLTAGGPVWVQLRPTEDGGDGVLDYDIVLGDCRFKIDAP